MMSRFDPLVRGLKIVGASARLLCAAGLLLISMVESVSASDSVQRSLSVRAEVAARNSLKTSAEILQFEVTNPDQPATASIQFSAGTRTQPDGEVLLIVEQLAAPERISDGRESGASEGMEPASVDAVDVSAPGRKVAKRWIGSGLRHGTIDFVLRAPESGLYDVTLQFMLSAP
jgi:hypothetical protein